MNLDQFKSKIISFAIQVGLDIKALNDWKDALINDAQTALTTIWSSQKVSDELANKVDKVAGQGLSDENYTLAEKNKLAGIEDPRYKGSFISEAALIAAYPEGAGQSWHNSETGWEANVDLGAGNEVSQYAWDADDLVWVKQLGQSNAETAASIKIKYESNPDTNAYTDAEASKLDAIEAGAQVNDVTGVKGSAEGTYRTGDVSISLANLDAGADDPFVTYTTARDS